MLLREEPRACDQGLTDVAYYPSEGSLIKILYRLYDALNTGSSRSTGTIMRWLTASDVLHASGLFVVGCVFTSLPLVDWLTGRPWSRYRFLAGANKYIQQESTFWHRSLWEKAGGELNA